MDNRYDRDRSRRDNRSDHREQGDYYGSRQAEQFDDGSTYGQDNDWSGGSRQYGDRDRSGTGESSYKSTMARPASRDRSHNDWSSERTYGSSGRTGDSTRYDTGYFSGSGAGSRSQSAQRTGFGSSRDYAYGSSSYDRNRSYDRADRNRGNDDRGFFERAGDEVASWFGDEDAARRRKADHRGSGPSGYTRSDERILEDACDCLTEDWDVDARNIQVTVNGGEVTLDGTVDDRGAKRRAEDIVHDISGVSHVQNNLRVQERTIASDTTSSI